MVKFENALQIVAAILALLTLWPAIGTAPELLEAHIHELAYALIACVMLALIVFTVNAIAGKHAPKL